MDHNVQIQGLSASTVSKEYQRFRQYDFPSRRGRGINEGKSTRYVEGSDLDLEVHATGNGK